MNGVGLIGAALLSIGASLLPLSVSKADWLLTAAALPFAIVGVLGLIDDLLLHEKIIKAILGIK